MNVAIIREALTLARSVIWESVSAHPEFDAIYLSDEAGDAEAMELAYEMSSNFDDCAALFAIDRALEELEGPDAKQGGEAVQ